jgi:CspA family cold shock protein
MATGTVKFFNNSKGYGFITPEQGKDIFFHKNDVQGQSPRDGDKVSFDVGRSEKGPCAINVRVR